ncbi:MAG: ABC transporter permease subunit [Bacteroidota bacterium]|nr:ABC transporter permease subunit [Bacteroidota bacterium]
MIKLLNIEFKKLLYYKTFWILSILLLFLLSLVTFGLQGFLGTIIDDSNTHSPIPIPKFSIYQFPDIWHNITFIAGYFRIFLGVILIILITNEFNFKTIRFNIINGLSRTEFFFSKFFLLLFLSLATTLVLLISGFILGYNNTINTSFSVVSSELYFVAAFFFEIICYLTFVMFVSLFMKRSGLAIGFILLYSYILEPIINYKLPESLQGLLPLTSFGNIIQLPNTQLMRVFGYEFSESIATTDLLISLVWVTIFAVASWYKVYKSDL